MSHNFNLKIEPKFLELLLVFFLINTVILLLHTNDFNFKVEYKDRVLCLKGRGDYIISPNELSIYFIRKIVLSSNPTSDIVLCCP